MTEENNEETIDNQVEETTTEEETQNVEQATTEKPEKSNSDLEETNKKLYARMKKAEEEAKSAKDELGKVKKPSNPDVFDLAKTVATLRDYNSEELGDIQLIAKAKGVSPEEAVKTEEAQLLVTARREKVAREKSIPEPSTGGGSAKGEKTLKDMTLDEKATYFAKQGFVRDFPKAKPL